MTAARAKLKRACETLAGIDPALAAAYAAIGVPPWRAAEPTYALLARTIVFQLLSTKAADTIAGRVEACLNGEVTPETVLACEPDALRACGLSWAKVRHMRSVAEAVQDGSLDLVRVSRADVDEARKELMAVKGIGPWTADLFLLYASGNLDAFPHGDVGLMEAHKRLGGYETRMTSKDFTAHAEGWRPYRGMAAHLLWGWLNAERAKGGLPPA